MALTVTTRPSGFNAVHLPIVYKLTSDKWPTNSVDTTRTVNTFTNDNGYAKLTLSGTLKTSLQELEFVKLTVNGTSGIYQIYQVFSDSQITIDLEYDGGTTFGNCQYYYSNYYVSVKVYAGLRGAHALNASKPYALITTINAVPDSSNIATINVNEILKNDIEVLTNNIDGATLPNDIESFTEFYIEYAEAYDYSIDGYTLSDYTSSYTSDASNYAIAVNSKLPFKNGYGGVMTNYVGSTRKFLTLFSQPTIFEGSYYDISFLRETPNTFTQLRRKLYSGTNLLSTLYDTIDSKDEGVYRLQIQKESTEDSIIVDLVTAAPTLQALALWTNQGSGNNWTTGANPSITLNTLFASSKLLAGTFNAPAGTYAINYNFDVTGGLQVVSYSIGLLDASLNVLDLESIDVSASGNFTGTANLTSSSTIAYVAFQLSIDDSGGSTSTDINSVSYSNVDPISFSESKTLNIDTECSNQEIYITWKNYLGGHEYYKFTAQKEYGIDIEETTTSTKNILIDWPTSYNSEAIDFETSRVSRETVVVRAENLDLDTLEGLKYIKTSSLVQVVTGTENTPILRNILVDSSSFRLYQDGDKLYSFEFAFKYTDTIPNQSL